MYHMYREYPIFMRPSNTQHSKFIDYFPNIWTMLTCFIPVPEALMANPSFWILIQNNFTLLENPYGIPILTIQSHAYEGYNGPKVQPKAN